MRVLVEHVELRSRAQELARQGSDVDVPALRALGERLEVHIRHEERVLFPAIEAGLAEEELAGVLRIPVRRGMGNKPY